jgi:hypothetical protein
MKERAKERERDREIREMNAVGKEGKEGWKS